MLQRQKRSFSSGSRLSRLQNLSRFRKSIRDKRSNSSPFVLKFLSSKVTHSWSAPFLCTEILHHTSPWMKLHHLFGTNRLDWPFKMTDGRFRFMDELIACHSYSLPWFNVSLTFIACISCIFKTHERGVAVRGAPPCHKAAWKWHEWTTIALCPSHMT